MLLRVLVAALCVVLVLIALLASVLHTWRRTAVGLAAFDRAGAEAAAVALDSSHFSQAFHDATVRRELRRLRHAGVLSDELSHELSSDAVTLQQLTAFWSSTEPDESELSDDQQQQPPQSQLLVVHVAHGLSNRLRTFASALAFAHRYHLTFRLIWLPDHHCQASFTQLFALPMSESTSTQHKEPPSPVHTLTHTLLHTWHRFRPTHLCSTPSCALPAQHLSASHFDSYHYIDAEGHDLGTPPILVPDPSHSLYIHSSSRLNHSSVRVDKDLYQALRVLQPSDQVAALLSSFDHHYPDVELGDALGLHIRQLQPQAELVDLQEHEYSSGQWTALTAARRLSTLEYFEQLVSATLESEPDTLFYVAVDSPAAIDELRRVFGEERFLSVRDVVASEASCDAHQRDVACARFALADQLLLSRCRAIHGSVMSSYSEVSGLWHQTPVHYPPGAEQLVIKEAQEAEAREMEAAAAAAAHELSRAVEQDEQDEAKQARPTRE